MQKFLNDEGSEIPDFPVERFEYCWIERWQKNKAESGGIKAGVADALEMEKQQGIV